MHGSICVHGAIRMVVAARSAGELDVKSVKLAGSNVFSSAMP